MRASGHEQTQGHIYRVKITSNDGAIAKGTLTPLAVVWQCPDSDTSTICKQARLFPDARREGDLLTTSLPEDISSELGKIGKMAIRDLLHVTQVFPFPGPQGRAIRTSRVLARRRYPSRPLHSIAMRQR